MSDRIWETRGLRAAATANNGGNAARSMPRALAELTASIVAITRAWIDGARHGVATDR